MALITVTGTIRDASNHVATSGSVIFALSNYFTNSSGIVITQREFVATVGSNGTISVAIESTTDAAPANRHYNVRFVGVINTHSAAQNLGTFQLANSPSSQDLGTLLSTSSTVPAAAFYDETPTGTINGTNVAFALTATPKSGTLKLYLSGILLLEGTDYTLSGNTITMTIPPFVGQWLFASYRTI